MKPDDVSVASIGMGATAVGAMTHGKVDAAIMTDPALEIVRQQLPKVAILADTRTAEGVRRDLRRRYVSVGGAVFHCAVAGAESRKASRLARAMNRTLDWMRTHTPADIRNQMARRSSAPPMPPPIWKDCATCKAMLSPDGRMTPESAAAVRKVLSISLEDVRTANIDLGKTYTERVCPAHRIDW